MYKYLKQSSKSLNSRTLSKKLKNSLHFHKSFTFLKIISKKLKECKYKYEM